MPYFVNNIDSKSIGDYFFVTLPKALFLFSYKRFKPVCTDYKFTPTYCALRFFRQGKTKNGTENFTSLCRYIA